jgi:hypothetical protein
MISPPYITATPVGQIGHHAKVMGDEYHAHAHVPLNALQEFENLGLDGYVQGGGGLVAYQNFRLTGRRHSDDHPLAHPPGKFVGILFIAKLGIGDAHPGQHLYGGDFRLTAFKSAVQADNFPDLFADGFLGD